MSNSKVQTQLFKSIPGKRGFLLFYEDLGILELLSPEFKCVGYLYWNLAEPNDTLELLQLEIDPEYRNQGFARILLLDAVPLMRREYPRARFLLAKTLTSKGVYNLLRSVYGEPVRVSNVRQLPYYSPRDWLTRKTYGAAVFRLPEYKSLAGWVRNSALLKFITGD
jgi:GNAT superfamily N-acetyltransferase